MILYKKAQQGSLVPSAYSDLKFKDWYTRSRGFKFNPSSASHDYRKYWEDGGRDINNKSALKPYKIK